MFPFLSINKMKDMLWILLTFKEKKEDEQQNLSQTYNKKEPNKGPKDSTIEKEVNDAGKDC